VLGTLKSTEYLVAFDGGAVVVGLATFEISSGEKTIQLAGDGTNIWLLTSGSLLKITPQ